MRVGLTAAGEDAIGATFIPQLGGFGLSRFLSGGWVSVANGDMREHRGEFGLTNLMATVWELRRFVPDGKRMS